MKTQYKYYLGFIVIFIIGILLGVTLFSSSDQKKEEQHDHSQEQADDSVWTCSMHPQIRQDESGECPICGMDLIPVSSMEDNIDPDAIVMSKNARKLAGVETLVIGDQKTISNLSFSGRLQINQDNTQSVTANFKARIERLFVNEKGEQVMKGQVIAELYAPEIQVLKEELELARRQDNQLLLKSIERKIANYELSVSDIESIENGRLKLKSPSTGVVSNLQVKQGDNLKADQNLMRIADLSTLWAIVDVYESDLQKLNAGDELKIQMPNYKDTSGKVTFISPVLDEKSRSAKARVVIQNPNRNLKPGVFITAELENSTSKTISDETLMVPKSAVLWTGKRSVVYQQLENENGIFFKMKEVGIGSSSSDFIEVISGLKDGDEIVTQGAFSVDSEAQLANKASMMNPKAEGGIEAEAEIEAEMNSIDIGEMKALLEEYHKLKNALVSDDFETSKVQYKQVNALFFELNSKKFQQVEKLNSIDELREEFIALSEHMIAIAKTSNPMDETIYIQRCPMADKGEGARWLSFSEQIKNPYYGASMLKCGSVIDSIQ